MNRRLMTWSGIGAVALFAAIGGAWLFLLPAVGDQQPARALDEALYGIRARYGVRTADFVAMQLEYPRPGVNH